MTKKLKYEKNCQHRYEITDILISNDLENFK